MNAFKYKGYTPDGDKIEGDIQAESIEAAERTLVSQDVTIVSIVPAGMRRKGRAGEPSSLSGVMPSRGRIKDEDLADILRDLAVMAEAGVPFVEALDAVIAGATKPSIKKGLKALRDEVVAGKSLSSAMRSAGQVFPPLVCEMVRVAEGGGRLERSLENAASYVERTAELKKKVSNAMMYPAVLTVIALLTVGVLIIVVLPKFGHVFSTMGIEVPVTTRIMLGVGQFVRGNPLLELGALAGLVGAAVFVARSPVLSRAVNRFLMKVPVVGDLMRKVAISRALESISTLLSSNVVLMSALEHGAKVSGNPVIEEGLMQARASVEQGGSLSESLAEMRVFPSTLVQMVGVGERTGRLAPLMAATAARMQSDVDVRLKALVSIVEPVMIVVMGSIVALITLSVIVPIYSVIDTLK